jgi:hypothetical protein
MFSGRFAVELEQKLFSAPLCGLFFTRLWKFKMGKHTSIGTRESKPIEKRREKSVFQSKKKKETRMGRVLPAVGRAHARVWQTKKTSTNI